ncbi:MAG TPA: non-canonical purine NTP pyrophosphatase, RdgB/HAM1 family [Rhodospirillaceae bacterium]|jgi:XTP/dITP diphosphohydrolase|nr:RdgB/HAM1 family non-canonical purine NTP pyrophosphatase [Alphaproteobacteria bacterium]HBH27185.1 non-canonical purine NTP pyrophosphatase, RdgB/HAM1 family [Rhodospirillaceae bacterium]
MERVVLATHNPGKASEMAALLAPYGVACVSAGELGLPEPEETETSFAGNARLKALAAARKSGLPALADDSGLCVAALGGAPGVHSARWAETSAGRDFAHAMRRLEKALISQTDRAAAFICALALAWPDGRCRVFEGRVDGTLTFPPRGEQGFGYDPIFVPVGDTRTFAEMGPAEKDTISHRARAFAALAASELRQDGS